MNMDFAAAMRVATKLTRDQKLIEATRVIQSALCWAGANRAPSEPAVKSSDRTHDRSHPECGS